MSSDHVVIIGAGQMGSGIAQVFIKAGFQVIVVDNQAATHARAQQSIEEGLRRWQKTGKIDNADQALSRLTITDVYPEEARQALLWVEAATESTAGKIEIFRYMAANTTPETILVTNTSSLSVTQLASCTDRPSQVAGLHFFNPVPLMPLVELVAAEQTAEQTLAALEEIGAKLEKTVIRVPDIPGFVANRVILPMIGEAIRLYEQCNMKPHSIDEVMRLGFFHPMGPLAMSDLIGLDTLLSIFLVLQEGYGERFRPPPILRRKVAAGHLGKKSGRGFYRYNTK